VTPLTPGKIALVAAVAAVVIVMTVWFRGHGWRVDALLWVAVAVALGLLVFVVLS
jgi:hypothetical protein